MELSGKFWEKVNKKLKSDAIIYWFKLLLFITRINLQNRFKTMLILKNMLETVIF
jgi:hypothetical protein